MRSTRLADIVDDARPGFASGKSDKDGYVQVRMNNVSADGDLSFKTVRRVPKSDTDLGRFTVEPGDILFNGTNSPELVGKSALFQGHHEPVVYSNHFLRIRLKRDQADPGYVSRWLRAKRAQGVFTAMCKQWVNQAAVEPKRLMSMTLPLPLLPEQHRIAAILDQADALRAKQRAALAQLDEMAQAIFVGMFKTPGSGAWPTATIGSLAESMRTGPFGSQLLHAEFTDAGVAVLGIDNAVSNGFAWGERRYVSQSKYQELARFRVFPKDVIVTIMGTCGRAAIVPDDIPLAITTKHLCSITLDTARCIPEYLHACFLLHPDVQRQLGVSARGAVMPGLNMGLIKGTMVPLPPLETQREFSKRLNATQVVRQTALRVMEQLDALFASLQHRAFAGEL